MKSAVLLLENTAINAETAVNIQQQECDDDLSTVLPQLYECVESLSNLKSAEAASISAIKTPPAPLKAVMAAVCLLLDVRMPKVKKQANKSPDYWTISKRLLVDPSFIQQLQSLDPGTITETAIDRILKEHSGDIDIGGLAKVSPMAEIISKWVKALLNYKIVSKEVAPKKEELLNLQEKFNEAQAVVNTKRKELTIQEQTYDKMKLDLAKSIEKRDELIGEKELTERLLDRAKHLYKILNSRQNEWSVNFENAKQSLEVVAGRSLLCSTTLTYLTNLNFCDRIGERNILCEFLNQREIKISPDCSDVMEDVVSSFVLHEWSITGLPTDLRAIEAAICILYSSR